MDTKNKRALDEFLMMLAATTVSIVLTFGTTAIIDRKKKKNEKREMVMMIMYDMRETLNKLEQCDQDLVSFFDAHVDAVAHPQQFEDYLLSMQIHIPTSDYTTTTESIFKSNIETIRTIGNILFVETVSSFYDNRSRYSDEVVQAFQQQAEAALQDYESLRDFDSFTYPFLSQAFLGIMKRDFDRCKLLMKVTDEDLEVFNVQQQKLLDSTDKTVGEDAQKASHEYQERKLKLQRAREEGMREIGY